MVLKRFIPRDPKERKRFLELCAVFLITLLLFVLARLETRVYELSENLATNKEFFKTLVYFGLINFNVILLLILCFLIFRNFAKLIVERQRGVFGSKLRSKLVFILAIFSIAPTILFFIISLQFITTAFDTWFSSKVTSAISQTREAGQLVYERDRKRVELLAKLATKNLETYSKKGTRQPELTFEGKRADVLNTFTAYGPPFVRYKVNAQKLTGFREGYGLDGLSLYDPFGRLMWPQPRSTKGVVKAPENSSEEDGEVRLPVGRPVLNHFLESSDDEMIGISSAVINDRNRDIVRAIVPLFIDNQFTGYLVAENWFGTQIIKSIEGVLAEFQSLRPSAKYVRMSYIVILILMSSLVLFISVWAGFYVARAITGPIQRLAEATREVALGNYAISLRTRGDDETGTLVRSFNRMTQDLMAHRKKIEESNYFLEKTNEELDERRKYIEVILKNITAGVISVAADGRVTSFNTAAERMLGIDSRVLVGVHIREVLSADLYRELWLPVQEKLQDGTSFSGQMDIVGFDNQAITVLAYGTRIFDENSQDLGSILVFDDATEQVKVQKIAAWKEVAKRIAHEIKNPITPIKINAQRLLRRYADKFEGEDAEVFRNCLESILTQVDSLRDLVNEFSKFSKMPSVKTRPENIIELTNEVVGMCRLSYSRIKFKVEFDEDISMVELDREQMNRVLMNVLLNAIDAVKSVKEPQITVRLGADQVINVVRIEIEDNGVGIEPHLRHRVLEPYFSTKLEGSGLGLAIVNQIIADHGGYLRISDGEKVGTKIIIELPLKRS